MKQQKSKRKNEQNRKWVFWREKKNQQNQSRKKLKTHTNSHCQEWKGCYYYGAYRHEKDDMEKL